MQRILGIDYGEKRIGLALSDPLGITARPFKLLVRTKLSQDLKEIQALLEEHEITKVVIGLPLNMDGSEGFMVEASRKFSSALSEIHTIEIIEMDERLTSQQADMALKSASLRGAKKKKHIDAVSAQIILQTYLDSIR